MASVADTAFLVAAFRAQESARPDALFVDPLAARLAGEPGRAMLERVGARADMTAWSVVMRTLLIDRFIVEAIEGGTATIVNLGAGLDTRPYRMELPPSLVWIEVDQEAVIAYKRERLAHETPRCRVERIALDLRDAVARRTLLLRLQRSSPALVLAEGLLPYLEEEQVAGLLDDLRGQGSVRTLLVDYIAPAVVRARNARSADGSLFAPMRFAPPDWVGFFLSHGWKVRQMRDLAEEGLRWRRPFVSPEPIARGTFAAYAILERGEAAR